MRSSWAKNSVRLSEHPVRLKFKNKVLQLASRHYPHVTHLCNGRNFEWDSNSPEALKNQISNVPAFWHPRVCKTNTRDCIILFLNHFSKLFRNYKVHFSTEYLLKFCKILSKYNCRCRRVLSPTVGCVLPSTQGAAAMFKAPYRTDKINVLTLYCFLQKVRRGE